MQVSFIEIRPLYILGKAGFVMRKGLVLIVTILLVIGSVLITGCNKNSGSKNSTGSPTSVNKAEVSAEKGDGTVTISLNISNPEQKQEKYNLIFAAVSSFKTGEPVRFFKSYAVDAGASYTVNIADLYSYCEMDESGKFKVGLTTARMEDINVRNPLSEIMTLTFPDLQTCSEGKNITLNMTDKPLTSLYPVGTLLVRIVDPESKGGYVDFSYKSTTNMTLKYGRGSSGPDFLVAFEATEFKTKGIRDAVLVITDENNQPISEQMELKFDENGYCKQGQYIEIKVNR